MQAGGRLFNVGPRLSESSPGTVPVLVCVLSGDRPWVEWGQSSGDSVGCYGLLVEWGQCWLLRAVSDTDTAAVQSFF